MKATTRTQKIDVETLLTVIFVVVDDWYQAHASRFLRGKRGVKPTFTDSELITLLLALDYFPFPGETQFVEYIRANYLALFPTLVDQSQFNRRARALRWLVEELRKHWAVMLGVTLERQFLLDTKPVPVVGYKRSKSHSEFAGSADYGVCVNRNLHDFGYKLVMLTTRDLERLLRKTVLGVCTHVIAKVTSHTLKLVLRRFFHVDVQTFSTEDLGLQTSN